MFGYDALFVNGNMAVGLWQNTCVVKVSESDQAKLPKKKASSARKIGSKN
jgi:TfoX/Sxy family transcriptional regulator of competence genes